MERSDSSGADCRLLEQRCGALRTPESDGGRTQVPEETEVIQDYRGQRFRRDGRRSSGTRRWLLCSRPGSLFHVEGLAEETLEETGSTALCDLPGPVFGSNGYHLSGDIWTSSQNIPGVGAGKAKRYGEEFCKLIKRHCEENEIERPEDLRVRTVANKSKMKVAIIQAIDRKVALDDIALSKGIEFGELLDEVEAIVYSGTN